MHETFTLVSYICRTLQAHAKLALVIILKAIHRLKPWKPEHDRPPPHNSKTVIACFIVGYKDDNVEQPPARGPEPGLDICWDQSLL